MIKENKDVSKMNDADLLIHIKKELYQKLNENLGFMKKILVVQKTQHMVY